MTSSPQPGQIARVRARQYLIEEVISPPSQDQMTRVRLSCVDDDAQGEPLEVLWEAELDAKLLDGSSWGRVASDGFDDPALFSAYLHTQRWHCVTATNPRLFQAPYRAGIDVMVYQLEPLRKALALPRVNLFIADDVGLGKTIEAGLIVRELLLRQKLRRVVVAAPPSVVYQWKEEMESRFGLTFEVYDREFVRAKRQERGFGVNPWQTHTRFIISHALLRDEQYAAPLRDWLGDFGAGAMLILDEAHHAAPSSSSRYAVDSKFTRTIRELAPRFEHKLFLSATPHNGHSNSFSALLELLDEQRFLRGVPIGGKKELEEVMVRRLKADLRAIGSADFPKRVVEQITIDGLRTDAPELKLAELLARYDELYTARHQATSSKAGAASALVLTALQKRLLSSIEAFASTLEVHRSGRIKRSAKARERALEAFIEQAELGLGPSDDAQLIDEAELEGRELDALALATKGLEHDEAIAQEEALLDQLQRIAQAHRHEPDSKARALIDWVRAKLLEPDEGGARRWANRRVIIFTEYTDTLNHLRDVLLQNLHDTDAPLTRLALYHGKSTEDEREQIKQAFNGDPSQHPVRILLATDAAREGVNLQNHCADLFHFDIPWNPGRMEQRNGRIDRKLQRAKEVRCRYFKLAQRPEDRVLETLVRKTELIEAELGSLSQVITAKIHSHMSRGIRRSQIEDMIRDIDQERSDAQRQVVVEQELDSSRESQQELQAQLDTLRRLLKDSKAQLGLRTDHLRQAIDCALKLNGAPPLEPLDQAQARWRFPKLDELQGSSWAPSVDTLRPPRERGVKLWQWRRETAPLPVIFTDPGNLDREVVHLHLEQRLVRRLLSRFLAQGFAHDDLTRACVIPTDNPTMRIVLLGKLSLFGPGAVRHHDELVPITAAWSIGDDPARLSPYKRDTEKLTLELLDDALLKHASHPVPEAALELLKRHAAADVNALLPHLTEQAALLKQRAITMLHERGQREARAMREVLERQQKKIAKQLMEHEAPQLTLGFDPRELKQAEAEARAWIARQESIKTDLEDEPARIQAHYEVQAHRLEPIGLIYLWPRSG